MIVIDCGTVQEKKDPLDKLPTWLDKFLKENPLGRKDVKAYQAMVSQIERHLSNKFFLVQNVVIQGVDKPISSVLIGPPGIFLLNTSFQKGIFRAKEESWAEMKSRNRQFIPAQPNLIKETHQMSGQLADYLTNYLVQPAVVTPILIMLNPGTHIDAVRPAVRTLLTDGLEHFIARLSLEPSKLTGEEVRTLVDRLREPPSTQPGAAEGEAPAEGTRPDLKALNPMRAIEPKISKNIDTLSNKLRFSTRQWIFLGVIGLVNIILLITFLILFLMNT
jgi:hypothetical protein